jgi:NADP-dependent 3-hydroxy acid dehydrogenase YdfG
LPDLAPQHGLPEHVARRPVAIAGASSGIGAEIARALAASGYPVVLGARRVDRCEQVAAEIRAAGGEAAAVELDVADSASVTAFGKAAADVFGEIDIVVANAGLMTPGRIADTTPDQLAAVLNTNVVGLQRLLTAFLPAMIARQRGDVLVISSDVVDQPRPLVGGYVSSKWAAEGLARTLQMELEGTGVRASIVRPGPTATEISAGWEMSDALEVVEAGKRFGSLRHFGWLAPSAVAQTVAHVVSAPRGTHIPLSHVTPEAPIKQRKGEGA